LFTISIAHEDVGSVYRKLLALTALLLHYHAFTWQSINHTVRHVWGYTRDNVSAWLMEMHTYQALQGKRMDFYLIKTDDL
jgi:hypothetical protein